jgi:hypothetical protein
MQAAAYRSFILLFGLGLAGFHAVAQAPWKWQDALAPDVGFDLDQAQVIRVTSLASKGKGTLREALSTKGPRIIVFEVGGVIDLEMKRLELEEPQAYLAGQTAPGPGITIIRGGLSIAGSQCVVQHLCVRPGDAGQPKKSGWQPDGITTTGGPVDVWIDHCSATWSCDENLSAASYKSPTGEPAQRIFIRDCIVAEGLKDATHDEGEHSKGTLVLDGTKNVAIVRCLYASNTERNPVFKLDTSGVVVNCLMANPGQRAIHAHVPEPGSTKPKARISVVGNVVLFGEKSKRSARAIFEGTADGYFKDNEGYDWFGKPLDLLRTPFPTLEKPPVWPEGLEPVSTTAALWHIARFVGAHPARRDPVDQRIVTTALNGTAHQIDSQDEVGGYPKGGAVSRPLKVPEKGRQSWLEALARDATYGMETPVILDLEKQKLPPNDLKPVVPPKTPKSDQPK